MFLRRNFLLSYAVLLMLVAGCSHDSLLDGHADGRCYFSGTEAPAPSWVCGKKPDGVAVMGVGQSGPSSAGASFDRRRSRVLAYEEVAMNIGFDLYASFEDYVGTTGAKTGTADAVSEAIVDAVSKMRLEGVEVVAYINHPKTNAVFALAVIKEKGKVNVAIDNVANKLANDANFKNSLGNEEATWQRFLATQARERSSKKQDR